MEKLHFDSLRLGSILSDVKLSEPFFRDANIAGFDMKSLSWQAVNQRGGAPNGIDARTICALARYAGISDRTEFFGVFEINSNPSFSNLIISFPSTNYSSTLV